MLEIWKDIPGHEGRHMVSSEGRIKSLDRIITDVNGFSYSKKGKVLNYGPSPHGYIFVRLDGNRKRYIHDLVCLAFKGPKPIGHHVDHINGNRSDNREVNLRYLTIKANTSKPGEKNGFSKLTEDVVLLIRSKYKRRTYGIYKLGEEFGVHPAHVYDIVTRKRWQHI